MGHLGSNAYLLSSEYSTYLSGRCVEIKMLPLSFSEFLYFHDFEVRETRSALGGVHKQVFDKSGERYELREAFEAFMRFGGMPGITDVGLDQEKIENVVYFELLRRGYDVAIGKVDNMEVDFIAATADEKKYIQVTESMNSEDVRKRELAPCKKYGTTMKRSCCRLNRDWIVPMKGSNLKI